ncbi:ThuA domain-containing protein [Egicoccus sp. AB-alg2]|uniref:ThuA domain-containing protein n=1 Tax=Egicoccus sp. AB-alg2 TaxID=3242693 RepID=UPI00359EDFCB
MKFARRRLLVGTTVAALALGIMPGATAVEDTDPFKVLVVGKTTGFRHASIVPATTAIMAMGDAHGFEVDVWDPPSTGVPGGNSPGQPDRTLPSTPFTSAADLAQYETLVFVSTVDGTNSLNPARPTLLDADELAALQGYVRAGGGFAGVHAATDSMHTVPWYGELTGGGARFRSHPANQLADKVVESPAHPSTQMLPPVWHRYDEWYNFFVSPRPSVHVLLNLDESTYGAGSGAMGEDHPIAWCHNFEGGRSWYTAGGHTNESFVTDVLFLEHLLQGILWSAGRVDGGGDCVTFFEVRNLLADLEAAEFDAPAERARQAAAVRNVTSHVDRGEALAEDGDRDGAMRELRTASTLARALGPDAAAGAVLSGKLLDLVAWQQGLADAGM